MKWCDISYAFFKKALFVIISSLTVILGHQVLDKSCLCKSHKATEISPKEIMHNKTKPQSFLFLHFFLLIQNISNNF